MRPAATRSSISFGSGGPAEAGAGCALTSALTSPTIAAMTSTLRKYCSRLVMTRSNLVRNSGLELGVPVEIIEPAFVQIIWREEPTVAVQVVHRRLERHLRWPHPRFVRREVAFAQIARRAGRNDVVPGRVAATRARQQVIEGEVVALAAVLAREAVAQEDVEPGEGRVGRRFHEGLERNHARQLHLERRAVHRAIVIGDDIHAFEKDCLDRVLPGPQRKRVIAQRPKIRVEHQSRETARRNVNVQATLLDLLEAAATQLMG